MLYILKSFFSLKPFPLILILLIFLSSGLEPPLTLLDVIIWKKKPHFESNKTNYLQPNKKNMSLTKISKAFWFSNRQHFFFRAKTFFDNFINFQKLSSVFHYFLFHNKVIFRKLGSVLIAYIVKPNWYFNFPNLYL